VELERWKTWARDRKVDVLAVAVAARDPRVPWHVKALAVSVVAYAVSPIDLVPDFIPVLGHLDDLLLVPAGVAVVIRLMPPEVWEECRLRASRGAPRPGKAAWLAAAVILLLWILVATSVLRRLLHGR
jgi:uncharacterized membrane protein YkvA (DUF1232 family)